MTKAPPGVSRFSPKNETLKVKKSQFLLTWKIINFSLKFKKSKTGTIPTFTPVGQRRTEFLKLKRRFILIFKTITVLHPNHHHSNSLPRFLKAHQLALLSTSKLQAIQCQNNHELILCKGRKKPSRECFSKRKYQRKFCVRSSLRARLQA